MKLVYDFILIVGIVMSAIIIFLLLKATKKKLPKKILITFFSFIFFLNLHAYAALHNLELLYNITFIFNMTVIWFFAPLIFIYIKSVFIDDKALLGKNFKHFSPFILFTALVGLPISIFLFTNATGFSYLQYLDANQTSIVTLSDFYFIFYIYASMRILNRYKKVLQHSHSNISGLDFQWIKNLLYGCLFFVTIDLLTRWMDVLSISTPIDIGFFTMFSIIVLTVYLGYYGILQSKILLPDFLIQKANRLPRDKHSKNSLSNYTKDNISRLTSKLTDAMKKDRLYLDSELTLGKLAVAIDTSDKKLSTLFNYYLETTFYDYINSFRINEVKKALGSDEKSKYTILAIALDCGFNSKASFNRIFKKETGLSPSQYRDQESNLLVKVSS